MSSALRMLKNPLVYGAPVMSFAVLYALFNATNPLTIGPLGILAVLALLYAFITSAMILVLEVVLGLASRFTTIRSSHKKRARAMVLLVGLAPVFIIALHSIGTVSVTDMTLVVLFITIGCFYIQKRVK